MIIRVVLVSMLALVPAVAQDQASQSPEKMQAADTPANTAAKAVPDRAAAYYHFAKAHNFEDIAGLYGMSEYASKAIDEYKLALISDPDSPQLKAGLAELYARNNRIRDAVLEAQNIIKQDPNNLDARKLLGRIYLRTLGDGQVSSQSQQDMLRLAIEQFEQIVKLEPKSQEDLLLLGRLLFGLGIAGHGFQKLLGWFGGPGLTGVTPIFEKFGFRPGRHFAMMASLGEISGGALLVLGLFGPVGPALAVLVMLVAAFSVAKNGFFATRNGIELPALYATGGLLFAGNGSRCIFAGLPSGFDERF